VRPQLFGVAAGDQGGDGDQAAVPGRELGAPPDVTEEDVVGEGHEFGRAKSPMIF
jgi:hypothetical protein